MRGWGRQGGDKVQAVGACRGAEEAGKGAEETSESSHGLSPGGGTGLGTEEWPLGL